MLHAFLCMHAHTETAFRVLFRKAVSPLLLFTERLQHTVLRRGEQNQRQNLSAPFI